MLDKTVIAIPLLDILDEEEKKKKKGGKPEPQLVIIDINLEYREGPAAARERVKAEIARAIKEYGSKSKRIEQGVNEAKSELSEQYLFARLEVPVIRGLVRIDNEERKASDDARRPAAPARDLPDLAGLQDQRAHQPQPGDGQGGCRAHLVLGARPGHRLGGARFGHRRAPPALRGARAR